MSSLSMQVFKKLAASLRNAIKILIEWQVPMKWKLKQYHDFFKKSDLKFNLERGPSSGTKMASALISASRTVKK